MQQVTWLVLLLALAACGKPQSASAPEPAAAYEVRNGLVVIQDDVILGAVGAESTHARAATGTGGSSLHTWPDGLIPYVIDGDVSTVNLEKAFAQFRDNTSLRFVPRASETDYVHFKKNTGWCGSQIGRAGGEQFVLVSADCDEGALVHELGHAVGLFHEQNRADRDDFVEVVWENVLPGTEFNFAKDASSSFAILADRLDVGDYDIGSAMQSPVNAFSRNGKPTLRAKNGAPIVGQRRGLTFKDMLGVATLYSTAPTRLDTAWTLGNPGSFAVEGTAYLPAGTKVGRTVSLTVSPTSGAQPAGASYGVFSRSALTTGAGTFRFRLGGLSPGSYKFAVELDGKTGSVDVTVDNADVTDAFFVVR